MAVVTTEITITGAGLGTEQPTNVIARLAGGLEFGTGGSDPDPDPDGSVGLVFSTPGNSQYLPLRSIGIN